MPRRKVLAGKLRETQDGAPAEQLRFSLLRDQFLAAPVESANHAFVATDLLGRITSWNCSVGVPARR
jgi:hypothetical protein